MDYRNLKGEIITYIRALFISAQYCPILTHFARYFGIITFSRSSISIFYNFFPLTVSVRACVCVCRIELVQSDFTVKLWWPCWL